MKNLYLFFLFILICQKISSQRVRQLFYLHNQENQSVENLDSLKQNSHNIPLKIINCKEVNCDKYKSKGVYPLLVFWNGAGSSYKHLTAPSVQALQQFLIKRDQNPIKPLRDFLDRISLMESFGVALSFGTLLHLIFASLFKDRSDQAKAKQKVN